MISEVKTHNSSSSITVEDLVEKKLEYKYMQRGESLWNKKININQKLSPEQWSYVDNDK